MLRRKIACIVNFFSFNKVLALFLTLLLFVGSFLILFKYPKPVGATGSLLTFDSKYIVTSTTAVTTTSTSLVDDTEASQTFNLSASKTVLVIYQANSVHGATMPIRGMQNAISVDGADVANSWDSPYSSNYATRNFTFWIGTLSAGDHTIKGRFASQTSGSTATISNRVLLIYIFNGDEFYYIDSSTASTTNSTALVDDPQASVTFTPPGACKGLTLYNVGNVNGSTEHSRGKKAAINVNGTDYSQAEKSPYSSNYSDSVFTCYASSLGAVSTTVKGRFAAHATSTVTISRRQLGVLLFADSSALDIITSDTQVSTTSSSLVDDAQATISRTTTDGRELLVIAMGTKRNGTSTSNYGECYGIMVDAVDRANSRGSPYGSSTANSAATAFGITLASGGHTVKGRFSNNTGTTSARIDSRRVIALWLIRPQITLTIDETYDRGAATPNGTNSVNFGTTGPENSPYVLNDGSGNYAIKLTVVSNVPWDYTVQASQDLTDGVKTIPISQLKWDTDPGSTWKSFTTTTYTISSNNPANSPAGISYKYDYQLNIT